MTRLLAREDGSALVTAILVTFLVLTVGLSTLATIDTQQGESRKQRERESTFQLSEGVLNAQIFQLSRRWPGTSTNGYPVSCTEGSGPVADCPAPAALVSSYVGPDYQQLSWVTTVHDNGSGAEQFYEGAVVSAQPRWDANRDQMMWVRAEARLRDPVRPDRFKERVLVALVKADSVPFFLPRATMVADHFEVTNEGNKTILDTNGAANEWLAGDVIVRCEAAGFEDVGECAQYDNSKQRKQLDPDTLVYSPEAAPTTLSPDKLDLLRSRAISEGNYYATGCAPSLAGDTPGEVVFMEATGDVCRYTANDVYNTDQQPGVVVIGAGKLYLAGNSTFYGLIYHANVADSSEAVVELGGGTSVHGSIQVAGRGGVYAGSNKLNLVFNPNYVDQMKSYGTAGIVQNSFRELGAGS